jgi:hypothetical protein
MDGADWSLMFVLGLGSSLHCTTMCGPILAVAQAPFLREARPRGVGFELLRGQFAYHLGRGLAYTLAGAVIGLLAQSLGALAPSRVFGGWVQIVVGIFLVGLGLLQFRHGVSGGALFREGSSLSRLFGRLVRSGRGLGMLGLGLFTGLLPCGVLYAAMARALATSSALEGAAVMLAFWAGTVPLLFAVGLASGGLIRGLARYAPILIFLALCTTGGWVVWKGVRNVTGHAPSHSHAPSTIH